MVKNSDEMKIFKHIFIVAGVFLLPGLQIAVFGWLYGLVPLLVFYYLCRYGNNAGGKYILSGALVALLAGTFLQVASQILLAMTLVPTGFILARSVVQQEAPPLAGLKGFAALSISWFLFSGMIAVTEGSHPYSMLLLSINQGMDEALKLYQENEKIPAESLYLLTQSFAQIKERLSQLMPAILTSIALLIVWLAMVLGNRLLDKNTGQSPWPEYQYWQLPEKLVWLVVAAAALALLPLPLARTIGFNLLLIASVIYCFQGLSIALFFLNKWKVPLFIRSLLYVIIVFQSLGTIFLSVIGLADVWFDLRHAGSHDSNQKKPL
ncbi:MAG: DUF2232 domain-containing protein [Deltaproteobacteria bacterium]|nr:DUF2232 domain-containing protein [Deltaproteobacteria bacterium]